MGVFVLYDKSQKMACLACSTSDWSLSGPLASDCEVCGEDAEDIMESFLDWCRDRNEVRDIRRVSELDLDHLWTVFMTLHNEHICRDCEGTGCVPQGPNEVTCGSCQGAGRIGGQTHEDEAVEVATGETVH